MKVDTNISSAVEFWYEYALPPGNCTELLLRGKYDEALKFAHPLIKPHWDDHIKYIETIPIECRNENYDKWRGREFHKHRVYLDETLFTDKGENE
jgi:hypothetical protein